MKKQNEAKKGLARKIGEIIGKIIRNIVVH